ncbi:helix-turn-helix transcriptional regulator [Klebsiella oxytoca]|uniref:helix-turn-helix transcriptional regulator n=1 Tax=Klebsiella oxytoca TaxID=571 RepID=UPI002591B485|nr:hypothetical protein [Klebsiella oxytoca]MDM4093025.1 hypothetical protein [Klebsiella oxytoca]
MLNVAVRDRNFFFRHGVSTLITEILNISPGNPSCHRMDNATEVDIFFVELYNIDSYNYIHTLLTTQKCIIVISTENLTLARSFIKYRDRVIVSNKQCSLTKLTKIIKEAVGLSKGLITGQNVSFYREIQHSFFTPIELYIIQSLKNGLCITDIAASLNLGVKTIYSHKYTARRKVGTSRDYFLVSFLLRGGGEDKAIYCCFHLADIQDS